MAVFVAPAFAKTSEQSVVKPGSFFYGFVTTFEKINLFFTFSPDKKAEKALKYAEKRLAEAKAVAEDENSDAVKTAISGYEENMAIASEASKEVEELKKQAAGKEEQEKQTPAPAEQLPQTKIETESQSITLTNALGISYVFEDPIINKQR